MDHLLHLSTAADHVGPFGRIMHPASKPEQVRNGFQELESLIWSPNKQGQGVPSCSPLSQHTSV